MRSSRRRLARRRTTGDGVAADDLDRLWGHGQRDVVVQNRGEGADFAGVPRPEKSVQHAPCVLVLDRAAVSSVVDTDRAGPTRR
jgi:hypothetical protein